MPTMNHRGQQSMSQLVPPRWDKGEGGKRGAGEKKGEEREVERVQLTGGPRSSLTGTPGQLDGDLGADRERPRSSHAETLE